VEDEPKSLSFNPSGSLWVPVAVQRAWGMEGIGGTLYYVTEGQRLILMPRAELRNYLASRPAPR
jgi:hypothetical protein